MPKGLRSINFIVDTEGFTRLGGLVIFQTFCKSLGIRRYLQRHVQWINSGRKYHPVDLFLTHMFIIAAGIGRIENTQVLTYNGLLPPILGLSEFPHRDTLRNFLLNATPDFLKSLQNAHNNLRTWALNEVFSIWSAVIDIDTTSLRIFGQQMEGGVFGYVPHYSHQRCYNVRLLTEANTGLSLAGELRAGNMLGVVGAVPFTSMGIKRLPSRIAASRIRLRGDAAFYDRKFAEFLDGEGIGYVTIARATKRVRPCLERIPYRRLKGQWEVAEFQYQPIHWKKAYRFIVVRKLVSLMEPPITLFVLKKYAYHISVTNLDLLPERTWQFYNQRMNQELLIRELKNHYAMVNIPSRKLLANKLYLEILLWAYDLIHLFKYLCLPAQYHHWSVSTIRRELWVVPAELVHTENRNCLKLPKLFPHKSIFIRAYEAAKKVKPIE